MKHNTAYSATEDAQLRELFNAGATDIEMSEQLQRSVKSIWSRRKRLGLLRNQTARSLCPVWDERANTILKFRCGEHVSYQNIGAELGRSASSCQQQAGKLKISNQLPKVKKEFNRPPKPEGLNRPGPNMAYVKPNLDAPADAITMLELTESSCRMIYGDKGNWKFCGKYVQAGSYCKLHSRICYTPTPRRAA